MIKMSIYYNWKRYNSTCVVTHELIDRQTHTHSDMHTDIGTKIHTDIETSGLEYSANRQTG